MSAGNPVNPVSINTLIKYFCENRKVNNFHVLSDSFFRKIDNGKLKNNEHYLSEILKTNRLQNLQQECKAGVLLVSTEYNQIEDNSEIIRFSDDTQKNISFLIINTQSISNLVITVFCACKENGYRFIKESPKITKIALAICETLITKHRNKTGTRDFISEPKFKISILNDLTLTANMPVNTNSLLLCLFWNFLNGSKDMKDAFRSGINVADFGEFGIICTNILKTMETWRVRKANSNYVKQGKEQEIKKKKNKQNPTRKRKMKKQETEAKRRCSTLFGADPQPGCSSNFSHNLSMSSVSTEKVSNAKPDSQNQLEEMKLKEQIRKLSHDKEEIIKNKDNEVSKLQGLLKESDKENAFLKNKHEKETNTLRKQLKATKDVRNNLDKQVSVLTKDLKNKNTTIKGITSKFQNCEKTCKELATKLERMTRRYEKAKQDSMARANKILNLSDNPETLKTEVEILKKRLKHLN